MKDYFLNCYRLSMLVMTLNVCAASSDTDLVKLSGHVPHQAVAESTFVQHVEDSALIPFTFILPLRNQDELEDLIKKIHDPMDEQHYGKYLTPEEFAERFAPTQEDYADLISYANNAGLTIQGVHANRVLLNVTGSAEAIKTAFNLSLHHYQKPSGQLFYAPNHDPEVPSSIASIIHGIVGLDNQALWHTYNRSKKIEEKNVHEHAKSNSYPSGPGGGYSPHDLILAYNLASISAQGAGQSIALFELGKYQQSDILAYTRQFGLPDPKLHNILVDGGASGGIDPEVTLDIELALALAPQSQIYVYEGPNSYQGVLDTYNKIATDNLAKQISTSWGLSENLVNAQYLNAENAIFQQMAAQGQTIYAAAGDSGAYDNYPTLTLEVDDPASQPYVVGVGGTRLHVNSLNGSYQSESVWNDGLGKGAGGGGVSKVWPIPTWQQHLCSASSTTRRNVPDVALNADPVTGYSIYYNGQWTIYGGTSCAAPLWAAFTALINQERIAANKPYLGFVNPLLYAIGMGTTRTSNFHDVTSGNNLYYSARQGYDNASGWGSFNGAALLTTLVNAGSQTNTASHAHTSEDLAMQHTHQ